MRDNFLTINQTISLVLVLLSRWKAMPLMRASQQQQQSLRSSLRCDGEIPGWPPGHFFKSAEISWGKKPRPCYRHRGIKMLFVQAAVLQTFRWAGAGTELYGPGGGVADANKFFASHVQRSQSCDDFSFDVE